MIRNRLPLTAVLPDARDRHRSAPALPKPQPPAAPETSPYRLPDGRIVLVYEDVARGAATVTYEMIRMADGARVVVNAVKVTPNSTPAWCQTLAAEILTTVQEWQADGANDPHLRQCIADILEQAIPEVRR